MDLNKYIQHGCFAVKVVPHASKARLIEEHSALKLYLASSPEKNKANKELIDFFKKGYNLRVRIKSGIKRRDKVIEIFTKD